jgi:hypothetical protein
MRAATTLRSNSAKSPSPMGRRVGPSVSKQSEAGVAGFISCSVPGPHTDLNEDSVAQAALND